MNNGPLLVLSQDTPVETVCIILYDFNHSLKDVIKTRYQNDLSQPNPLHTLKQLYRSEGPRCFTRGKLSVRLI